MRKSRVEFADMRASTLAALALLLFACGSSSSSSAPTGDAGGGTDATATGPDAGGGGDGAATGDGAAAGDGAATDDGGIGGSRPVAVHVPPSYVQGTPMPLVIMLHGYSVTSKIEETYLKLTPLADARGFLYATPDGLIDSQGNQYWNATDACCAFGKTVDDSTYLSTVIKQIQARYTVDPKRVFFVGHSNGGFMSHRMACDHADQVAAIASLAGAMNLDVSKCAPKQPVSILEIHGTADTTIDYNGGANAGFSYPGAITTVNDWVTLDGCSATADTSSPPVDFEVTLAGAETTVTKYAAGCKPGGHAELWTITGGGHIPSFSPTFAPAVIDFLFAHPKP